MPRPRPPETLRTFHVRFTMTQWRKIQGLGGAAWLRKLVSEFNPTRARSSIEAMRMMAERNRAIAAHPGTNVEVGRLYNLSPSRVSHIRAQMRA